MAGYTKAEIISIHALLAESDHMCLLPATKPAQFLSTLSLRRATSASSARHTAAPHFYPRSPCGERQPPYCTGTTSTDFYPRSPCGERLPRVAFTLWGVLFLSTLSLRRATSREYAMKYRPSISIHALLAESDRREGPRCQGLSEFLSTLSLRRATRKQAQHHKRT